MDRTKYILIGGNPFTTHNGTTTFTGLRVVGRYETQDDLARAIERHYGPCAGLLIAIDNLGNVVE